MAGHAKERRGRARIGMGLPGDLISLVTRTHRVPSPVPESRREHSCSFAGQPSATMCADCAGAYLAGVSGKTMLRHAIPASIQPVAVLGQKRFVREALDGY